MIDIFNIKTEPSEGEFDEINSLLQTGNPEYVQNHGLIGSPKWWTSIENGTLDTFVIEAQVMTLRKELSEENEILDIAEIEADKANLEIILTYYNEDHGVKIGDRLQMESIAIFTEKDRPESIWNLELRLSKIVA